MTKNIREILFIAVPSLLLVGFIVLLSVRGWFCSVDFSESVSPIDVFNFLLTAFVAIWLGQYITKRSTEQRFIKEFLIADIRKIEEGLEELRTLTSKDDADLDSIFERLDHVEREIGFFQRTIGEAGMDIPPVAKLKTLHRNIYSATTDSEGDKVEFASKREAINPLYDEFIFFLRKIICHINRLT